MKLKKGLKFETELRDSKHDKVRDDEKKQAQKKPKGARFGKAWYPYNKSGG